RSWHLERDGRRGRKARRLVVQIDNVVLDAVEGLTQQRLVIAPNASERDGLTVLDRMRADRRLTALHRRLETPAEPNFPRPKKLGQIFRLRVHRTAAGYRPSAG